MDILPIEFFKRNLKWKVKNSNMMEIVTRKKIIIIMNLNDNRELISREIRK